MSPSLRRRIVGVRVCLQRLLYHSETLLFVELFVEFLDLRELVWYRVCLNDTDRRVSDEVAASMSQIVVTMRRTGRLPAWFGADGPPYIG